MESFGERIRKLREEKGLPLRTVAAYLGIDQAILSKIERGQRKASRKQVVKLAGYFKVKESELLIAWLSDKLVYAMEDESVALRAMQVAEEKMKYHSTPKPGKDSLIRSIQEVLKKDGRVSTAWLFGSVVRGDQKSNSDIDIMVEMNARKKYSMFDMLDIAHSIEQKIKRKVDLVEKGYLKDFALRTAANDMIKIYG
jgi:predicted nucleotidyltransferase/DNA-binding XRE family transcriptional regulator